MVVGKVESITYPVTTCSRRNRFWNLFVVTHFNLWSSGCGLGVVLVSIFNFLLCFIFIFVARICQLMMSLIRPREIIFAFDQTNIYNFRIYLSTVANGTVDKTPTDMFKTTRRWHGMRMTYFLKVSGSFFDGKFGLTTWRKYLFLRSLRNVSSFRTSKSCQHSFSSWKWRLDFNIPENASLIVVIISISSSGSNSWIFAT